ncbi:hypothetical protein PGIGA_G00226110 [Pangasianodon gigas]|uniref:Uncharacterized protein n=1 Tax=Pangasianodon gigas TaxID=30993 RepID=A0ACC5WKD4_PANGG|nr:hypothetical protein [Pangasianodon gigas]
MPSMPSETWIHMFDNYVLALTADDMLDKRKCALLIHSVGTEVQRIFCTLPVDTDTYTAVLEAIKKFFFMPKLNVVAERNKGFISMHSEQVDPSVDSLPDKVHSASSLTEVWPS